ncbi:hypothetical protein GOP47_0005153 [Adiantum capillus-veneris]|uniref:Uncharacterized protein n=1 Tax=Adiantum capillus-veneris TaxID=13818 RepID=A0A9D4ZLB0_ADICA|nr:hypothetical protein GOP47_0005153 [Adiantum capillus-veneris]
MFGSSFFIPEQVIQFRQDRLAAIGATIEYTCLKGLVGFGGGAFVQKILTGPYEMWEVEVTDLAIGIGMSTLLLPGTRRVASSVRVGERLILLAVYLLLTESISETEVGHVQDDHFTHGQMSITSPCALIASRTCEENVVNDDNAKFANTSKVMEKQIGRSNILVDELVHEYHSIDMTSNLGRQATLCKKEAFKTKEDDESAAQEIKASSDFENGDIKSKSSVDLDVLTKEDKEAIVMKYLGKNDVDAMYGSLSSKVKLIQEANNVHFVDVQGSTSKIVMLDTLVSWVIALGKVHVNQRIGLVATQDVIVLS